VTASKAKYVNPKLATLAKAMLSASSRFLQGTFKQLLAMSLQEVEPSLFKDRSPALFSFPNNCWIPSGKKVEPDPAKE
jgi:hypothetical protein